MLMAIGSIQQGARRTNFDAVAALRAIQPAAERADDRIRAPITGFNRLLAHPFVADPRATLAENATLRIVCHHRRKISLCLRILFFDETFFEIPPIESKFLQFTLAAAIAHGTIKRMIREQELEHRTLRLFNLFALRSDD